MGHTVQSDSPHFVDIVLVVTRVSEMQSTARGLTESTRRVRERAGMQRSTQTRYVFKIF